MATYLDGKQKLSLNSNSSNESNDSNASYNSTSSSNNKTRKKREELEKTVCKNVSYGEFNSESCVGRFPQVMATSNLLAHTRGTL